jgi:hypothetical protein
MAGAGIAVTVHADLCEVCALTPLLRRRIVSLIET